MNSVELKLRSFDGKVCRTCEKIHSSLLGVVGIAGLMFISLALAASAKTDEFSRECVNP